jgi:DNA-binding winged helix-turn-helix (wHTH) protein/alpha-beta hydrolase superfamily lysophospholipase
LLFGPGAEAGRAALSYLFEDYSLDAGRRELRRGAELVPVEPLVFDLLEFLIRSRDRVVSKDEVFASVWNGRIVSESTLTSRMNAARHAVGDSGEQQRLIRTIPRKGFRFVGDVQERTPLETQKNLAAEIAGSPQLPMPTVSFHRAPDGTNLAVATAGDGPVLLRTAQWINHLEHEWANPLTRPLWQRLSRQFCLIRYDGRGAGLSDRTVPDMSFPQYEHDLESIVETLQLNRFALLGMSGGAALAISYAARHPERVSKLILYGGYPQGRNKRRSPQSADEARTMLAMMRSGWGDGDSLFFRAFSAFWLPNGNVDQMKALIELQRTAFSPETAVAGRVAVDEIDVVDLLTHVRAPTIVFHCVRDRLVPFEQGRLIATSIPKAKFVPLDSENHMLLPDEPAWTKFVSEMEAFLTDKQ